MTVSSAAKRSGHRLPGALLLLVALLPAAAPAAPAAEGDSELVTTARSAANRLLQGIRNELATEMERTGPIRAITVCKYSAPELSSAISRQTGMRVTRVALRLRNPLLGQPDAWEQKQLLDFEKRLAKGEKTDTMEVVQVVNEPAGRYFRYLKAIPVGQPCLACHGSQETMAEGVKAVLVNEYPHDRATGFRLGDIRGAVSVKKRLGD